VKPAAQRKAVEHVRELFAISERRACAILSVDRTSMRYAHRRSDDGDLRSRLREIALERRRFGYRRLGIMLAREGIVMNHKKLLRLYREENLRVRRRRGRKRAMGTRAPMTLPQGPNQRWSLDFVSDTLACGRRFRMLAVVDDFTRECLVLVADTSLSGARVGRELDAIIAARGTPLMIVNVLWHRTDQPGNPAMGASSGTISRRASRSRMAMSRASMAVCTMNASTRCYSHR